MVITSAINIDMQYKYVNTYVDAVQYDVNSRNVEITLLKAGSRAEIPTGSTFEVKFKRPDGSSGSYSELSNGQAAVTKKETNVIVVWLSEFILSEAGETVVSVCVKDGETEVNTFSFIVNVQESPHIGTGLARMYPNTYDATATPSDIAIGKTAYVNGEKILGTSVQADDENVDLTGYATEEWVQEGFQPKGNYALKTEIPAVPVQSVNGKTGAVALNASDVGARPSNWMPSASDVGALPASTTFPVTSVNDRTGDVKLTAELVGARPYNWLPTAADIGALPASTKIPTKVSELKNDAGYLTEVPEEYAKKEDIPTKPSDIGAVATINGVAPDDNGNVELASATSWNDLSHRPFGDKYGDTFTWDGNIYGLTGAKFSYDFAGRLYNVTSWDYEGPTVEEFRRATITMVSDTGWEQEYTDFTVLDSNSGVHGIEILTTNSSGTTFPLLVYLPDTISGPTGSYTSGLYLLRTDAGAWVKTITIPGCTKLIKTEHLNAKYLPEVEAIGDVWVKDLKERIGAGADTGAGAVSTVNGVAPDANGNVEIVTSWYDLEDRPFGETVSDTVTWDGNTEGRSSSTFGYDSYHCTYYKVCDTALPMEECVGLRVSAVYVKPTGGEDVQSVKIYANGDLIVGGNPVSKAFFVYSPGEGVFLPKDDAPYVGWVKSITIEGYNGFITGLKKLDSNLLPEVENLESKWVNDLAERMGVGDVDLSGYAQKSELPTKVSQLQNDAGYLTQHQDISGKLDVSALPSAINTALAQAKASGEFDGPKGDSVGIKSISESDESGGTSRITFTDGKMLAIKNGIDGHDPVRGVDYWTPDDIAAIDADIATELAKRGQLKPEFAESLEWLKENGDQTKMYVLCDKTDPDYGMVYAWKLTEKEVSTGGGYTNKLPLATDTDRKTIYGASEGTPGYRKGQRLSSSGATSSNAAAYATGFIPVKEGDVVRIKGIKGLSGTQGYIISYNSANTKIVNNNIPSDDVFLEDWAKDGTDSFTWFEYDAESHAIKTTITSANYGSGVDAIRFSCGYIDANTIVTVNEAIVEGGTEIVKEYAWASTGLAFIPADYEGRIIAVENTASKNTARIVALEKSVESGGADETEKAALDRIQKWDKPVYDPAPVTLIADDRVKPALATSDRTVDAIYAKYRALMAAHPDYIKETNMGKSAGSSTFTAVDMLRFDFCEPGGLTQPDLNDSARHETKPTLIFLSGIHTEWAGVWGLYYALEEIATNPDFDDVRRNARIVVIPCANPYCLAWTTSVDGWRMSHVNANGVAIHNNFGVNHSTSGNVGEYNYGGPAPYSEPETQYIDAVMAEFPDAVAFVSCHNNDYSTYYGSHVIWASSATYHMCNVAFRLVDKLTKAWLNKYGQTLKDSIDQYKINMDANDYRLGRATMSTSKGTEQLNATKYGIMGVNLEIARMMKVFSGNTDGTSEVMTHGAEVYANFMRTLLWSYDPKDKKEYAPNLPWNG